MTNSLITILTYHNRSKQMLETNIMTWTCEQVRDWIQCQIIPIARHSQSFHDNYINGIQLVHLCNNIDEITFIEMNKLHKLILRKLVFRLQHQQLTSEA